MPTYTEHVTRGCACGCEEDTYNFIFPEPPTVPNYGGATPLPHVFLTLERIGKQFGSRIVPPNPKTGGKYMGKCASFELGGGGDDDGSTSGPYFGYHYYSTYTDVAFLSYEPGGIARPIFQLGSGGWTSRDTGLPGFLGTFVEGDANVTTAGGYPALPEVGGWQKDNEAPFYGTAKWIIYTAAISYHQFGNYNDNLVRYATRRDWYLLDGETA